MCVCVNGDGKKVEKCREYFFFWSLFIWQTMYLYPHIAIPM